MTVSVVGVLSTDAVLMLASPTGATTRTDDRHSCRDYQRSTGKHATRMRESGEIHDLSTHGMREMLCASPRLT
jgi:hypothetical protein